ncbi:hypothetical protein K523DRAFT_361630 [Schizophyllum commune Tattone D]|nr:hypothetical protein K525DRAFT_265121 [Schizophyllum commune Loenen D]KAI5832564.1 hypothetical protein K523DRAFT_361630 [Schizophyllum commune Tattone D]
MSSGLFYALVHFVIGMLEACLLQDLSMTARRVLLAVITPMAIALGIYFITPPVILQYCDDIRIEAHASLTAMMKVDRDLGASSTHTSTEIPVLTEVRDRLQILDQKKHDLERTVWGRRRNAFICSIMSLPRSYAAMKLLCAYNTVSHDLKVVSCSWEPRARPPNRQSTRDPNVDVEVGIADSSPRDLHASASG